MEVKSALALFGLALFAIAFTGCIQQQASIPSPSTAVSSVAAPSVSSVPSVQPTAHMLSINVTVTAPAQHYFFSKIVTSGVGESAFQVFLKAVSMGSKSSSFGTYVYSVNGINESKGEGLYWQFYFNNTLAPVGVESYNISQEGVLEWRLEKPQFGS